MLSSGRRQPARVVDVERARVSVPKVKGRKIGGAIFVLLFALLVDVNYFP